MRFQKYRRSGKQRWKHNDEKASRLPWRQFRLYFNWSDTCPGNRFCCSYCVTTVSLLEFHRIAVLEQQKAVQRGDFQRFLLLLKSELIQAAYALSSGSETAVEISSHSLVFKADRDTDGDVADTREKTPIVMIRKRKYSTENQGMLLTKHWLNPFMTLNLK